MEGISDIPFLSFLPLTNLTSFLDKLVKGTSSSICSISGEPEPSPGDSSHTVSGICQEFPCVLSSTAQAEKCLILTAVPQAIAHDLANA